MNSRGLLTPSRQFVAPVLLIRFSMLAGSAASMELAPSWLRWFPFQSNMSNMLQVLALTAVHFCLTKSDLQLGMARLIQKCRHQRTPRQVEQKLRFEKELLKARLELLGLVQCVAIHISFVFALTTMCKLMEKPDQASLLQAIGPVLAYCHHALFQAGILEIKTKTHFRIVEALAAAAYGAYLCGLAIETEGTNEVCFVEKISGVALVLTSVVFLDLTLTIPIYLLQLLITYNQWKSVGEVNLMLMCSTLISHTSAAAMVAFVIYAIQSRIAVKVDSDQISSLLLGFRKVIRGACDGDLLLDSDSCTIVDDASSLERVLKVEKKLTGTSFWDLFLDTESRQRFLQFVSETARESLTPSKCLRINLQGAEGPVSIDVFCTSCEAAGHDYYLLAFNTDSAHDEFREAKALNNPGSGQSPREKLEQQDTASNEVAEAFKELVQVSLLVNKDTASMDIEEVTLSFLRSGNETSMPTLRSLIRLHDWQHVQQIFNDISMRPGQKIRRLKPSLCFRIPGGSRYLCARDVVVSGDQDENSENAQETEMNSSPHLSPHSSSHSSSHSSYSSYSSFVVNLSGFDAREKRSPKEHSLESIREE